MQGPTCSGAGAGGGEHDAVGAHPVHDVALVELVQLVQLVLHALPPRVLGGGMGWASRVQQTGAQPVLGADQVGGLLSGDDGVPVRLEDGQHLPHEQGGAWQLAQEPGHGGCSSLVVGLVPLCRGGGHVDVLVGEAEIVGEGHGVAARYGRHASDSRL